MMDQDQMLHFPPIEKCIFFDIETDMGARKVWMIGAKINNVIFQAMARNWKEENDVLLEFSEFLNSFQNYPLVCYSGTNFDFRVLYQSAKRLNCTPLINAMQNRLWIDMLTQMRRVRKVPGGMGLKRMGALFNYKFRQEGMDGAKLAITYSRMLHRSGKISDEFVQIANDYNLDDIELLPYILERIQKYVIVSSRFMSPRDPKVMDKSCFKASQVYSTSNSLNIRILKPKDDSDDRKYQNDSFLKTCTGIENFLIPKGIPYPKYSESQRSRIYKWTGQFAQERIREVLKKNKIAVN